jgi:hypothetical protein
VRPLSLCRAELCSRQRMLVATLAPRARSLEPGHAAWRALRTSATPFCVHALMRPPPEPISFAWAGHRDVRQGASLSEIGELLGHQSPETTKIYTKVDLNALRTLALPWPEGVR